jgi:hypothetical protein
MGAVRLIAFCPHLVTAPMIGGHNDDLHYDLLISSQAILMNLAYYYRGFRKFALICTLYYTTAVQNPGGSENVDRASL